MFVWPWTRPVLWSAASGQTLSQSRVLHQTGSSLENRRCCSQTSQDLLYQHCNTKPDTHCLDSWLRARSRSSRNTIKNMLNLKNISYVWADGDLTAHLKGRGQLTLCLLSSLTDPLQSHVVLHQIHTRLKEEKMNSWKVALNYRRIVQTDTWSISVPLSWTPSQCIWGDAGQSPLLQGRCHHWWTSPQKLPSGSPGRRYQKYLHPGHKQRYWKKAQISFLHPNLSHVVYVSVGIFSTHILSWVLSRP